MINGNVWKCGKGGKSYPIYISVMEEGVNSLIKELIESTKVRGIANTCGGGEIIGRDLGSDFQKSLREM